MLTDYTEEKEVHKYLPETVTAGSGKVLSLFDGDGVIIQANLPAVVPSRYVKKAEYSGDSEIFACLDSPAMIEDEPIRPPSIGVWAMLEAIESPFVNQFGNGLDLIHCYRALYINRFRKESASDVYNFRFIHDRDKEFDYDDESTWSILDKKSIAYADVAKFDLVDIKNWWDIRIFFDLSFNGYSMLPSTGGGGSEYLFGAETMGGIVSGLGASFPSRSLDELLWETPMVLLGHATAALARSNGTKGICRQFCKQDIRKQLILATAREYKGELHPWQLDEPLRRQLTEIQKKNKGLVAKWDKIVNEANKKAGK